MTNPHQARPALNLGNTRVTALSDGHLDVPGDYFPGAALTGIADEAGKVRFGATIWLIETETRRILVDTGSGESLLARFPVTGLFTSTPGFERVSINDVIITHMHADHIGGLSIAGKPLFPSAKIHLQSSEWAYWTDPALPDFVPDMKKPMVLQIQALAESFAEQIVLHNGTADLGEGITLLPAPGHTPGHQIVEIKGSTGTCLILGDAVVAGALQFTNPDQVYALESDPELARNTRRALFERLAAENLPFSATHLAGMPFGTLTGDGTGYRFHPIG